MELDLYQPDDRLPLDGKARDRADPKVLKQERHEYTAAVAKGPNGKPMIGAGVETQTSRPPKMRWQINRTVDTVFSHTQVIEARVNRTSQSTIDWPVTHSANTYTLARAVLVMELIIIEQ